MTCTSQIKYKSGLFLAKSYLRLPINNKYIM
jgi:hypothetical protein